MYCSYLAQEIPARFMRMHHTRLGTRVKLQGIQDVSPVCTVACSFINDRGRPRLYFRNGWSDFVKNNFLRVGQRLVFTLTADSFFVVRPALNICRSMIRDNEWWSCERAKHYLATLATHFGQWHSSLFEVRSMQRTRHMWIEWLFKLVVFFIVYSTKHSCGHQVDRETFVQGARTVLIWVWTMNWQRQNNLTLLNNFGQSWRSWLFLSQVLGTKWVLTK